ncbi:MAG: hypothetical protein IPI67_19700 [Myxococcales bacterium]|nr:hypothetical protein [Myxococcales bacterium]
MLPTAEASLRQAADVPKLQLAPKQGYASGSMPLRPRAALLAGLLLMACAEPKVPLTEGAREYAPTDYEIVLDRWTRSDDLITVTELDNVLAVTATYESWDFRWAYVVRYADDYRLTVDQRRALLESSLAETRSSHTFYVALHAQRFKWGDLSADNPAWIVRLIDDQGSETAPLEIEPIKKPGAIERTYFPYTTPWRSAYRIRFPKLRSDGRPTIANRARWIGLRFAGAQGNQALVWEIESSDGRAVSRRGSPRAAVH